MNRFWQALLPVLRHWKSTTIRTFQFHQLLKAWICEVEDSSNQNAGKIVPNVTRITTGSSRNVIRIVRIIMRRICVLYYTCVHTDAWKMCIFALNMILSPTAEHNYRATGKTFITWPVMSVARWQWNNDNLNLEFGVAGFTNIWHEIMVTPLRTARAIWT